MKLLKFTYLPLLELFRYKVFVTSTDPKFVLQEESSTAYFVYYLFSEFNYLYSLYMR